MTHDAKTLPLAAQQITPYLWRLPLPVPFAEGNVNCYLFTGQETILVDTGPRTRAAWAALQAHFETLEVSISDLRHVIVTHAHVDHHGSLDWLLERAPQARVHCHRFAAPAIGEFENQIATRAAELPALMRLWGIVLDDVDALIALYGGFGKMGRSVGMACIDVLTGSHATLALGDHTLQWHHTPGHSDGHIVLHDARGDGVVITGDHVLEHITPNPGVTTGEHEGRKTGLGDYLESLHATSTLKAALALPGHGEPFGDLAGRCRAILAHHAQRAERILALVRHRPRTVFDLVPQMWGELPPLEIYLGCREVHGHLELLVEGGRCTQTQRDDGALLFEAV